MVQNTNASDPTVEKFHQYNPITTRWYWTLRVFLAFFTIAGNLPLILLFITRRRLRRILSNRFIMSLNLADLCVGLFVTPPELVCTYWKKCDRHIQLAMYEFFVYTSMLCLCLVTWDRYKSVIRPLSYPVAVKVKQYLIPIMVCWAVPFVVALLHFTYLVQKPEQQGTAMEVFTVVEAVLFIALPCLALPLAFLHIACIIQRHKQHEKRQQEQVDFNYSDAMLSDHGQCTLRETEWSVTVNLSPHSARGAPNAQCGKKPSVREIDSDVERSTDCSITLSQKPKQRQPNHDRAITALGIVITWFVACWVLAAYLHLKESFSTATIAHLDLKTTMNLSWLLLLAHSGLNPIVYGFVKRDIKKELTKFFNCRK